MLSHSVLVATLGGECIHEFRGIVRRSTGNNRLYACVVRVVLGSPRNQFINDSYAGFSLAVDGLFYREAADTFRRQDRCCVTVCYQFRSVASFGDQFWIFPSIAAAEFNSTQGMGMRYARLPSASAMR